MKAFKYMAPISLQYALSKLSENSSQAKILAGGTDLFVEIKKNNTMPSELIDIKRIPDLDNISFAKNNSLEIGPLVTISKLATHVKVGKFFPALNEAASSIGSIQTRNKATVGGNICRAAPSGDMAPALLIYQAKALITGIVGSREVDLEKFFLGPGQTVIRPNEMLTNILIPISNNKVSSLYIKRGRRSTVDLAVTGVAGLIEWHDDKNTVKECRIALASVAPRPIRVHNAELLLKDKEITFKLIEKCSKEASKECKPISDVYGSEWYKRELVNALVTQCLRKIMESRKN